MAEQNIIMNFSRPPSDEDLGVIASDVLETLPEEILQSCESLSVMIEELPDEALLSETDIDDPYELVALYKSGKQISPGVESKIANDDDLLIIFRRPLLDVWCETGIDLSALVREVMIEELGGRFDFSDEEIEEMTARHYQGML